jgi:hypothetical protein
MYVLIKGRTHGFNLPSKVVPVQEHLIAVHDVLLLQDHDGQKKPMIQSMASSFGSTIGLKYSTDVKHRQITNRET